jgi:hypothetical protein
MPTTALDVAVEVESGTATDGDGALGDLVNELGHAADALRGVQLRRDFFRTPFRTDGYFDRAFAGEGEVLKDLEVFKRVDMVVLAKMGGVTCSGDPYGGAQTCDVALRFRVIDQSGRTIDEGEVRNSAPGLSQEDARKNAFAKLGPAGARRLLRAAGR